MPGDRVFYRLPFVRLKRKHTGPRGVLPLLSGGRWWLGLDGVADGFELADEFACSLGGVFAADEVVRAEVVEGWFRGSMWKIDTRMLCSTATRAWAWPRRGRSRVYWAAR